MGDFYQEWGRRSVGNRNLPSPIAGLPTYSPTFTSGLTAAPIGSIRTFTRLQLGVNCVRRIDESVVA
jgi:hypothetical protein